MQMRVVNSIDEAVMLVQGRLAVADHKTVVDYAWTRTPLTSTRALLSTQTPYLKNQDQLNDVCVNTNVKASMVSKHDVMLSFDPVLEPKEPNSQAKEPKEPNSQATNVGVLNWYQVMQEENQNLRIGNEKLKAEIERLKAENVEVKNDVEEEKLYWMDQMNIAERRFGQEVEDLKEALQGSHNELREQSRSDISIVNVNSKHFRDVYERMLSAMGQNLTTAAHYANMLLGMIGEPYDQTMSLDQMLHKIGCVMACDGETDQRSEYLSRAIRLVWKSLNKKMDPVMLGHYREMVNELTN